jgi:hypothetical protein
MREGSGGHQAGGDEDPEAPPSPYAPTEVTPPYQRAEPYGPTEAARTYPPPRDSSPYARTEVTPPRNPPRDSSPYAPTEVTPPYGRTEPSSPYAATEVTPPYGRTEPSSPYGPTQASGRPRADASGRPQDLVRYGPGVPPSEVPSAAMTAEHVWRTGRPEKPARRPPRWRRLAGTALTVVLLAASGVLLFLRFHHAPFHVTRAAINETTQRGCGVTVTGQIYTNGAAGTVDYEWVFQPDPNPPQPLKQSINSGQHSVFVTVAVQASGQGSASQKVTLQVLGPDRATASRSVVVSCR